MPSITVSNLKKTYRVYHKDPGFVGSVKSLFSRKYHDVHAVAGLSFSIEPGELVGFIGPNGAGKTTTLKILSGLLYPDSGKVSVLGFLPWERKTEFKKQFSLVMGQKNQLWWDLPAMDSLLLNKEIYGIPADRFNRSLAELSAMLEVGNLLKIQVRKLSLGQRMKMELIAALIHSPQILFLDEPTIGLDVVMQKKMRDFIREYNRTSGSTILLTSHYMEDVKELCNRVIIIDAGKILFDGKLSDIVNEFSAYKLITVVLGKKFNLKDLQSIAPVVSFDYPQVVFSVPRPDVPRVAQLLLRQLQVTDLNIEEPGIESVVRDIFSHSST